MDSKASSSFWSSRCWPAGTRNAETGWRGFAADRLLHDHSFWMDGAGGGDRVGRLEPAVLLDGRWLPLADGWAAALAVYREGHRSVLLVAAWQTAFNLTSATEATSAVAETVTSLVVIAWAVWILRREQVAPPPGPVLSRHFHRNKLTFIKVSLPRWEMTPCLRFAILAEWLFVLVRDDLLVEHFQCSRVKGYQPEGPCGPAPTCWLFSRLSVSRPPRGLIQEGRMVGYRRNSVSRTGVSPCSRCSPLAGRQHVVVVA
jgi:hypothetical protein